MSDSSIPTLPPCGETLLVTDELSSPADFILYRSLGAHLKASGKSGKTVVLSPSANTAKWKAIMAKTVCLFVETFRNIAHIRFAQ